MVDADTVRGWFLALAGAGECQPFGPDVLVYKVGGKMFATLGFEDEVGRINLKCDPERTWTGLAFQVADVVAGARELVAGGGGLKHEPMGDAEGEPPHLALCVDTEGNEIMLTRQR